MRPWRYRVVLINRTPRGLLAVPTSRTFWRRARAKAAAAYGLEREMTGPAPDHVMRQVYLRRLTAAITALTYEEKTMLARRRDEL